MLAPGIKYQTIFYNLGWEGGVRGRLPPQNTEFKGHLKKTIVRFKFLIYFLAWHFEIISDLYRVAKAIQGISEYASPMLEKL